MEVISFEAGKRILDTCPGSVLLDVRTEDEYAIEHAAGAVLLPLEDLIDREKEIERLTKEQERLTKEIARCEGMLNNPNFVNKAPAAKVETEKEKLEKYKEMQEKVNLQLTQMVK